MKSYQYFVTIIFITLVGCLPFSPAGAQDLQRGFQNYKEILSGKKKLEHLSLQEQQEVLIIHRRALAQGQGVESKSSSCRDALIRAKNAASELAEYARRLRGCAEANDYTEDCSAEFRRTRNAYNDYEMAVSSVSSNCR